MGVSVDFQDLHARVMHGETYEDHCQLAEAVERKVIAIDASQWIFENYNSGRIRYLQQYSHSTGEEWKKGAITLLCDRMLQILRYGGHPVMVLDGKPPPEKKNMNFTGTNTMHGMRGAAISLCQSMGVCCIEAPSEAEAMCAALNEKGLVDMVWTSDVVDAFMFGAVTVMRAKRAEGSFARASAMVYLQPHKSTFNVITLDNMASFVGTQDDVDDALTFTAALIGSDYNEGGLQGSGKTCAPLITRTLSKAWLSRKASGAVAGGFLDFAKSVILQETEPVIIETEEQKGHKARFKSFLAKSSHGGSFGFLADLAKVTRVVREQRALAKKYTEMYSRKTMLWDYDKVDHFKMFAVLEKFGCDVAENGSDERLSRIMTVESEKMIRAGERADSSVIKIHSISKPKFPAVWKPCIKAEEGECFQFLVEVVRNPVGLDMLPDAARMMMDEYLTKLSSKKKALKETLDIPARHARASAIIEQWPNLYMQYRSKLLQTTKQGRSWKTGTGAPLDETNNSVGQGKKPGRAKAAGITGRPIQTGQAARQPSIMDCWSNAFDCHAAAACQQLSCTAHSTLPDSNAIQANFHDGTALLSSSMGKSLSPSSGRSQRCPGTQHTRRALVFGGSSHLISRQSLDRDKSHEFTKASDSSWSPCSSRTSMGAHRSGIKLEQPVQASQSAITIADDSSDELECKLRTVAIQSPAKRSAIIDLTGGSPAKVACSSAEFGT